MASLLERSILMTLGAAMLTKEMAESLGDSLAQKGGETTSLGREAVDEAVDKAKEEARSLRGRFDSTIQRNFRELGLAPSTEVDELKLKVAQLEHRIKLLEADSTAMKTPEMAAAGQEPEDTQANAAKSEAATLKEG
jgi:polyhydroxyalkanoate synthesis regulator phasin